MPIKMGCRPLFGKTKRERGHVNIMPAAPVVWLVFLQNIRIRF
ncbi:MAG: hypothetical protein PHN49_02780 [Candidatus Omnitrophica bacterium]|nr:hypothetical protein [Candidatus Omnitrophota bacterium]MDD5670544.1 hypothetical protein [Candidatus Omnitrophota bacterium]